MIESFIIVNENYDVDILNSVICNFLNIDTIPYLDTRFVFHYKKLEEFITYKEKEENIYIMLSDNIIALDYVCYDRIYIISEDYNISKLLDNKLIVNMIEEGLCISGLYLAGYFK